MAFTHSWSPSDPSDAEDINLGAERIRDFKLDIRERVAVDHSFAGDANDGLHLHSEYIPRVSAPTLVNAADGVTYTQVIAGITELFYKDSGGNVTQITSGGRVVGAVGLQRSLVTVSGAFTIPAANVVATLIGAGGGGGGGQQDSSDPASGAGGGAGASTLYPLTGLTVGSTLTVTIGAAGTGGAINGADGTDGGDTVLASGTQSITTGTAGGGKGGSGADMVPPTVPGGAGGVASGAAYAMSGQKGHVGYAAVNQEAIGGRGGVNSGGLGILGFGGDGGEGTGVSAAAGDNGQPGAILFEWMA